MRVDFRKGNHAFFFGVIIPLVSLFIAWLFHEAYGKQLPYWMETLSPVYFYMLIFAGFDKYAWAWPPFRWFGIVTTPDLRGRWIGEQISSYKADGEKNARIETVLEIKQTFSKLIARAFYKASDSRSALADVLEVDDEAYLFYTYDNEPNSLKTEAMKTHRGTVKLLFVPGEKRLCGKYFNDIGNTGDMELKFESKKLWYRFGK